MSLVPAVPLPVTLYLLWTCISIGLYVPCRVSKVRSCRDEREASRTH